MTATNHSLTGALIAVAIGNPIAIPVAFLAHFAMDAIPHFGVSEEDVIKKHRSKLFVRVLVIDSLVALLALIFVPQILHAKVSIWLCVASMIACMSPDLVWGWHFYHSIRNHTLRSFGWFSKAHKKIQWKETELGALVEAAWFVGAWIIILNVQ